MGLIFDEGFMSDETMTTAELEALQGANGEYYRGMQVPPNDGLSTSSTMTTAELEALQGANGEYYRGGFVIDSEEYRIKETGTADEDIARLMTELSQFNYKNSTSVEQMVAKISSQKESVVKLLEYRAGKMLDMLYGTGDYSTDRLFTDVSILNALQKNGFDFSNITIDVSSLVNDSNKMTIMSLIEYIIHGVREKEGYGYDTTIIDPNDAQSTISVVDALEQVKEKHYNACLQAFQDERQSQLAEDAIDRDVKASKVSADSLTEEDNYGGNHI